MHGMHYVPSLVLLHALGVFSSNTQPCISAESQPRLSRTALYTVPVSSTKTVALQTLHAVLFMANAVHDARQVEMCNEVACHHMKAGNIASIF